MSPAAVHDLWDSGFVILLLKLYLIVFRAQFPSTPFSPSPFVIIKAFQMAADYDADRDTKQSVEKILVFFRPRISL